MRLNELGSRQALEARQAARRIGNSLFPGLRNRSACCLGIDCNPYIMPCQARFWPPRNPRAPFVCCRYTECTYTSVFQTIFCSPLVRLQPNLSYVQPDMHKPRPRKPSSLPPFRFFFDHPPQRPFDLPLIPPPHPPEPRQHIRIQIPHPGFAPSPNVTRFLATLRRPWNAPVPRFPKPQVWRSSDFS